MFFCLNSMSACSASLSCWRQVAVLVAEPLGGAFGLRQAALEVVLDVDLRRGVGEQRRQLGVVAGGLQGHDARVLAAARRRTDALEAAARRRSTLAGSLQFSRRHQARHRDSACWARSSSCTAPWRRRAPASGCRCTRSSVCSVSCEVHQSPLDVDDVAEVRSRGTAGRCESMTRVACGLVQLRLLGDDEADEQRHAPRRCRGSATCACAGPTRMTSGLKPARSRHSGGVSAWVSHAWTARRLS